MNQMDANLNYLLSSPQNVDLPQTFRGSTISSFVLIYIKTMASAPFIQHSNQITGIIHPQSAVTGYQSKSECFTYYYLVTLMLMKSTSVSPLSQSKLVRQKPADFHCILCLFGGAGLLGCLSDLMS